MTYVPTWHFHFQKNEGVNGRAAEGVSKYPPKNAMKITKSQLNICPITQSTPKASGS